jgi:Polyketide cyclase / dehydrase and lipid transport
MWRRVTVHATIDQPVEWVFRYLADPTSWHEFVPAVVLRRPLESGPAGVGSTWQATDRIGPFHIHFIDQLAEIEAGRRVVWHSSSPWNARTEYVLEAMKGRTRVRARYEGDIGGWLRLLAWLPGPVVARILAQDFKRLEKLLRSRHPAPDAIA